MTDTTDQPSTSPSAEPLVMPAGNDVTATPIAAAEAAIETAEGVRDKDDVPAAKLLVDTYKWAAEVNDPATYGKKVAHSGEVNGNVTLQVITGFGPPNAWQTPPKLKADGTIDAEWESLNGPQRKDGPDESNPPPTPPGAPEGVGEDRPPDAASSRRDDGIGGVPTLPAEPGHETPPRSA